MTFRTTGMLLQSSSMYNTGEQLQLTSSNTTRQVKSVKLNGFVHINLSIYSSQNRCVLPPDDVRRDAPFNVVFYAVTGYI